MKLILRMDPKPMGTDLKNLVDSASLWLTCSTFIILPFGCGRYSKKKPKSSAWRSLENCEIHCLIVTSLLWALHLEGRSGQPAKGVPC